ncbi:2-hydroxy-3-oxopropionate reductase-like [Panulirus ornatus]|uniref:2-hydroxy-3-oxopropionate reductase-like n=1 Tax=Panulirus ornatus TaxID=150431 RepID=UPI003A88B5A7
MSVLRRSAIPTMMLRSLQLARGIATATKATKIGVVGCGRVGTSMSHNLTREGFRVVAAFDVDPTRYAALPQGIAQASSPREVTQMVDVVFTGLARPSDVREAVEGPDGILAGLSKDKVWIDHSTTDCEKTKEYSVEAQTKGAHVLEAPLTGGLEPLRKGSMVTHVGGDKTVADAMTLILDASCCKVFYVGEIGNAMIVKVTTNMLAMVNVIAMGEVLLIAKRAGMNLRTFWEAVRCSSGNSFAWETAGPMIFSGIYDPGFPITLVNKDLHLGQDMARKYKVPIDLNLATLGISRWTEYQLGEEVGCYSPPKIYEAALGESLADPSFNNWIYDLEINKGSIVVVHGEKE